MIITEEMLLKLRSDVKPYLTEKRYAHTLAVEKEAAALGRIYSDGKIPELRAAALLHDITKKLSLEKQLQYCEKFGIIVNKGDILSPKIFHAKTAAELAKREFPDFASDDVINGVRWHTTGHRRMSLFEALVYLADYIEETRTFGDCVRLREYFYTSLDENGKAKEEALISTMIMSFDMTVANLISEGAPIDSDTIGARNFYIEKSRMYTES